MNTCSPAFERQDGNDQQLVAGFGRCRQRRIEGYLYKTNTGHSKGHDRNFRDLSDGFGIARTSNVMARRARSNSITTGRSAQAVVPEIDHCVGQGLECVVQLTETIKTKQQSPELVFPGKHAFDRSKSLFEYG